LKGLATMDGRLRGLSNTEELEVELTQNQGSLPSDKEHLNLIKQIMQRITKGKKA